MDPPELAREYYAAIDGDDYERLRTLLAPTFVQERADRTFEGRSEFVRFMAEERPVTDTSHEIDGTVHNGDAVVVEGTLYDPSGERMFAFADVFTCAEGQLQSLRTYTR